MGCSNTLTDAQLQVMFSTTDEEMQRIKQPMDWPIERTKHKCKKCVRFFSNETALKQHHFELPFKKKKFPPPPPPPPHWAKAINHANNLEKHLRSCEKAPTNPAR